MGVEVGVEDLIEVLRQADHLGRRHADPAAAGEVTVLLGPSGTGKSVFLKSLIGLLKPDKGSIFIRDIDIARCSRVTSSTRPASCSACCSRTARCSAR